MFHPSPRMMVFLVAMLPFSELRGAIPLAIGEYGMSPLESLALALAGNLVPVLLLLHLLGPIERRLRFIGLFDRFFESLFQRTRRRHSERMQRYGALGLVTFVAIPLPVTGAWTGVAIAYVFGIKKRYAFPAIASGVVLAGAIVTLGTLGVLKGVLS